VDVFTSYALLRPSSLPFQLLRLDSILTHTPQIPLGRYFPEYVGGNDLQKATKYILWKFMQENRPRLTVYPQ
jgi:guanine nucleotide-binding protein subunit alpha